MSYSSTMKKLIVRVLAVTSVLAFAVTVAAAEAPRAPQPSTLACTKSGMTCGSNGQCCSHSCKIPHGRVVGRCN